jgi:hypothetical protein
MRFSIAIPRWRPGIPARAPVVVIIVVIICHLAPAAGLPLIVGCCLGSWAASPVGRRPTALA